MEIHALPQHEVFEIFRANHCRIMEIRENNWLGSPRAVSNSFLVLKD